jgi:hypothetical protein
MAQPSSKMDRIPASLRRRKYMKAVNLQEFELEIGIEELEPKVAPDGGETVVPIPMIPKHLR